MLLVLLGVEILTISPQKLDLRTASKAPKSSVELSEVSGGQDTAWDIVGFNLVGTTNGKREWELQAERAAGLKDQKQTNLKDVVIHFFGEQKTNYTVKGDFGAVRADNKDMEIRGNVLMNTSEGYVLKTQSLKYDAGPKNLSTNDFVQMEGPAEKDGKLLLSGAGFLTDTNSSVMKLSDRVTATKNVGPGRPMKIQSVRAEINGKTNVADFDKNVTVDIDNIKMEGDHAKFIYDSTDKALKSLLLTGNVRVSDQSYSATSLSAQVNFKEEEFILRGNPRVLREENELFGDEIRLLKGGKEVKVYKAKAKVDKDPDEFLKKGANE